MKNFPESDDRPPPQPQDSFRFGQRFKLSTLEMLFAGLIFLGLFYLGYFVLFQESSGSFSKIEKKIKTMEASSLEQTEKLDKTLNTVRGSLTQLESRLKAIEVRQKQLETVKQDLVAKLSKSEKRSGQEKNTPAKEKIQYKVRKGETIFSIAKKFRVFTDDVRRWNHLEKNKGVRPGDLLIIYPR